MMHLDKRVSDGISTFHFYNAVSLASDIFERIRIGHGKRVAYTAVRLAEHSKLPMAEICKLYYAGILHDLGTGYAFNEAAAQGRECQKSEHAIHGSAIILDLFSDKAMSDGVLGHHENWNGSGAIGLSANQISFYGQILRLSDFFDVTYHRKTSFYEEKKTLQKIITEEKGKMFSPEMVDLFLAATEAEDFWLDYRHENMESTYNKIEAFDSSALSYEKLIAISHVCAKIVDEKTNYTTQHSLRVATFMQAVVKAKNYDPLTQNKAYLAGLLHDLGKVSILSSVLDKPGPLTIEERYHVNTHPYFTRMILDSIPNFEDVAQWTGHHHEFMNGTGYPGHLKSDKLDYFSRLLTVCDAYQAMREERPYRKAMSEENAWKTIHEMRDQQLLCPEACDDLKACLSSDLLKPANLE